MRPEQSLPLDPSWSSTDEYVDSLLTFVSTSELFRNLCGGVHVLDFLTRKPDLYSRVLPQEWRDWFEAVDIADILDLLLREDLSAVSENGTRWRNYSLPPASLVEYIKSIRIHSLRREYRPRNGKAPSLPKHVAVGMKTKKVHEVSEFATFVDDLSQHLSHNQSQTSQAGGPSQERPVNTSTTPASSNHIEEGFTIIDFGSGQNYLGRTLASPPYSRKVMAIEQRHHNVEGAKGMDVSAKLATKEKKIINKKIWKEQWIASKAMPVDIPTVLPTDPFLNGIVTADTMEDIESRIPQIDIYEEDATILTETHHITTKQERRAAKSRNSSDSKEAINAVATGSIEYVEKALSSGDLNDLLSGRAESSLVVSIHSCGNLTHHGLRSIVLNPSVRAVAMIGCCYNLLTERLGPPTYKLPTLRSNHPRLESTSTAFDPHGFPMSKKLEDFTYPIKSDLAKANACRKVYNLNGELQEIDVTGKGVRLNITARMMAVQAPHNWGPKDSDDFFTRHYFRALLQRILLDLGVVKMAHSSAAGDVEIAGGTLSGKDDAGTPLMIGSLRKSCFTSFETYVRGAIDKLVVDPQDGPEIMAKTNCLFENNGLMINQYEKEYFEAKKHLSVIWSLMAFSANVVESTILVDRWLWLREQEQVKDAWVEAVFDYKQSPRNMVVVGIKADPSLCV